MNTRRSVQLCLILLAVVAAEYVRAEEDLEGFADEDEDELAEDATTVDSAHRKERLSGDFPFQRSTEETPERQEAAGTAPTKPASKWDVDEFEGFEEDDKKGFDIPAAAKPGVRPRRSIWIKQDSYTNEIIGFVLLVVYLLNVLWGKIQNERLALAWAGAFVMDGSLIEKNFAIIGVGDEQEGDMLMKESHSCFKFYASGRRYCQGMLATLDLKSRQDLLSVLFYAVTSKKDTIDIDVYMNEVDMGPMVCVLASPKQMKLLVRENEDVKTYTREIPVKQIPKWPLDKVNVWTESPDVFYDLMVPEIKSVFLAPEFHSVYGKYFRYIYITSDYSQGSHKCVIKLSFNLPVQSKMHELGRWMSLVPLLIDLVAEYAPSQEAKKRAEKHRALESERIWKEGAEERKEAFQQKKAEEQQAEMERIRRMPPEEQQKCLEKKQKLKQRRSMKVKTLRA